MTNSIGRNFILTIFGESHGKCVGVIVDGCPPGIPLSEDDIQKELDRRKPGKDFFSTGRIEEDKVEILSGVFNGYTTGAPLCMVLYNKDVVSDVYEEFKWKPRPGHADYPAFIKYHGFHDYRGGGIFSSRITVGFVAAGAVAKKLLRKLGIEVYAHVVEIGGVRVKRRITFEEVKEKAEKSLLKCCDPEAEAEMRNTILKAREENDSVGGVIECFAINVPPGVGEPIFNSLDAELAKFLFCIPAVKGVEFGAGFDAARLRGSENNDEYRVINGKIVTLTNNAGGILGGLSTGMPIIVRVAFKPPSSIPKVQKTVDLSKMENTELRIKGRYDVCFIPRAVPIVEAVVANVLIDHLLPTFKHSPKKFD
ncbi:MAG: chorismate synthase [Candidatus Bathyarchaeota archaeon]|nr:chorismate synthase [Candidatus Bathyarchaeota archaeon]